MLGIYRKIENQNHERYRVSQDKTIRRNEKRRSRSLMGRLAVEDDFQVGVHLEARRDPRIDE